MMSDPVDHNPFLTQTRIGAPAGSNANPAPRAPKIALVPQRGSIDPPHRAVGGGAENLAWQTRDHAPTAYENALGDAIEAAFEAGADSSAAMAEHLNSQGVHAPDGSPWTAASFETVMRELGA
jgi:hypothetical protein